MFEAVLNNSINLMNDAFGNYVIQKLFECGPPEQHLQLLDQMRGHILELSLHMYGCRVIQKALDVVELPLQVRCIFFKNY
jgi:pumilio RNA-binding family